MEIHILTIFPNMFTGFKAESIIRRALENQLVNIEIHDLRKWTNDERKTTDDRPFGGGPGMVMLVEPIDKAVDEIKSQSTNEFLVILTSAKGQKFTQKLAVEFVNPGKSLIIICGHYEGVDERVAQNIADIELSIGDFVLTGGELPAMVIVDAVTRLVPGVLGNPDSLVSESHDDQQLEYPQYTRPQNYTAQNGQVWSVPQILTSGNHEQIDKWRKQNKTDAPGP